MAYLVSPCCGDKEYTDIHEHGYDTLVCSICEESFDEPELDYEYDERMLESKSELNDDERRDLRQ